jgi:hypothetical protein
MRYIFSLLLFFNFLSVNAQKLGFEQRAGLCPVTSSVQLNDKLLVFSHGLEQNQVGFDTIILISTYNFYLQIQHIDTLRKVDFPLDSVFGIQLPIGQSAYLVNDSLVRFIVNGYGITSSITKRLPAIYEYNMSSRKVQLIYLFHPAKITSRNLIVQEALRIPQTKRLFLFSSYEYQNKNTTKTENYVWVLYGDTFISKSIGYKYEFLRMRNFIIDKSGASFYTIFSNTDSLNFPTRQIVNKYDLNGSGMWQFIPETNVSFTNNNVQIAQLNDGDIACIWSNSHYKVDKLPKGILSKTPFPNSNIIEQFALLSDDEGELELKKSLNTEIFRHLPFYRRNRFSTVRQYSKMKQFGDQIIVTGYFTDSNESGVLKAMPLVLSISSKTNKLNWYSEFDWNVLDTGERKIMPKDVFQLSNNRFVLLGEYEHSSWRITQNEEPNQWVSIVFDSTGCVVEGCKQFIGLEPLKQRLSVSVYPNPSNGLIQFKTLENTLLKRLNVYSINMELVYSEEFIQKTGLVQSANLSTLQSGIYFAEIVDAVGKKMHLKIVLE